MRSGSGTQITTSVPVPSGSEKVGFRFRSVPAILGSVGSDFLFFKIKVKISFLSNFLTNFSL